MKISTSNGKRTTHHKTAREGRFDGTYLSLDHRTHPVGLTFKDADEWRNQILVSMTLEEAENIHRALGETIELRKRQRAAGIQVSSFSAPK